jgi:copper chaperone
MSQIMIESSLFVPAISCDHCKRAIEGAVGRLDGVEAVSVDVAKKLVAVRFDSALVDRRSIVAAMEDAGYQVPESAAPVSSEG